MSYLAIIPLCQKNDTIKQLILESFILCLPVTSCKGSPWLRALGPLCFWFHDQVEKTNDFTFSLGSACGWESSGTLTHLFAISESVPFVCL